MMAVTASLPALWVFTKDPPLILERIVVFTDRHTIHKSTHDVARGIVRPLCGAWNHKTLEPRQPELRLWNRDSSGGKYVGLSCSPVTRIEREFDVHDRTPQIMKT